MLALCESVRMGVRGTLQMRWVFAIYLVADGDFWVGSGVQNTDELFTFRKPAGRTVTGQEQPLSQVC